MVLEIEILRNCLDVLANDTVPNYNKKTLLREVLQALEPYPIATQKKTKVDVFVMRAGYLAKVGISQHYGFSRYIKTVRHEIENALSILIDNK